MVVVDWAREAWIKVVWLFTRAGYCFKNADAFDECRPFWATLMLTVIGIGVLVLLVVGKNVVTQHLKYRQILKRREVELEIASDEDMQQAKWNDEKAFDTSLSVAEIAQRIKAEKDRTKAARSASLTDRSKGNPKLGRDAS